MLKILPWVYALVVCAEVALLSVRYATDPPAASSEFSIWLGWGGISSMVVMLVYSIARRSRRLRELARLSAWLHFHIFLGVQGVVFAFFHSLPLFLRETPIRWLNPAVGNLVMVGVIFGSGLFGRYLYAQLPRALGGEALAVRDVEAELAKAGPVGPEVEALWKGAPATTGFLSLVRADFATRAAIRKIGTLSLPTEVADMATRRVRLERRLAALKVANIYFSRWIVLHRPLAVMVYVISAMHIALSYMFTPSLGR